MNVTTLGSSQKDGWLVRDWWGGFTRTASTRKEKTEWPEQLKTPHKNNQYSLRNWTSFNQQGKWNHSQAKIVTNNPPMGARVSCFSKNQPNRSNSNHHRQNQPAINQWAWLETGGLVFKTTGQLESPATQNRKQQSSMRTVHAQRHGSWRTTETGATPITTNTTNQLNHWTWSGQGLVSTSWATGITRKQKSEPTIYRWLIGWWGGFVILDFGLFYSEKKTLRWKSLRIFEPPKF